PWDDPEGALTNYQEQREALEAGRKHRPDAEGTTVKLLANQFLNHKRRLADNGEITERTWSEYKAACDRIVATFGKRRLASALDPTDFADLRTRLARKWGPVALGNEIQRVRSVFKFAYEAGLIGQPMRFGPGFKRPSKKVLRLQRANKGPQMF